MDCGCHVLSENLWFVSFLNVIMWRKGRVLCGFGGSGGSGLVVGGSVNSGCHELSDRITNAFLDQ